ncbi:MAG TPA: flagellar hook-associated protein FlgK [Roseiarcus sp.]|nr:flagellar hook-associated protein FlgK [Roseiarcus sp.]
MTLSSAFNIIDTSFSAIAKQSSTIATNIANANTPSYSRQVANLGTTAYDGVTVYSVIREANVALAAQLNSTTADSAAQTAISNGLATLAQTVSDSATSTSTTGSLQNGASPYAQLANFSAAIATFEAQPESDSAAQAAVAAAQSVASSLDAGARTVTQVRTQADQQIAGAVGTVNSLLNQFTSVNSSVMSGLASGSDVGSLQDQRDSLVTQIAQQIGVTTTVNTNGSMSIFTDSGVPLFESAPSQLTFTASGTLGPNQSGNAVSVNGTPITGPSSNMPIQSGAIAGLAQLRDSIAPQYQAQLDQIAGNLMTAFQETDQSTTATGLPTLPGLFTTPGAASTPSSPNWTGLANALVVNPSVDPTQGGNAFLIRDGGVSDASNLNYTYNATGDAGYTGRLQQLVSALQAPMGFSTNAGLATTDSISAYAASSVSWLQGANERASGNATYQSSLLSSASSALSNATGVNLDTELTNMLTIESSYTASAKLVTTVTSMLNSLVSAI